jgi:filamentous hemagglutinin family protein
MNNKFQPLRALRTIGFHMAPLFLWFYFCEVSQAQTTQPITPSGLNTQVSGPISIGANTQYNITGGTRPGNGANLFHSFGEFGIPTSNIANFLNETALPTSNILGRVTGGNPSNIFGTIQTTGFGSANLYLMNPAGIVFGLNATLNVGGSVTFTTANNFRLSDGILFNAVPGPADALLSTAPVAAFGFLGSTPGTITVQGSNLSVQPGQAINLVSGDLTIQPTEVEPGTLQTARLIAPEGQINLVSVASAGEVLASNFQPARGLTLGSMRLGQGTLVDVSGDAAGTVRILGGELVIDNSTISADTVNGNGTQVAVDIQATGDLSIATELNPVITARTTGSGDAGAVQITARNIDVTAIMDDFTSLIDTHTSASGKAGDVHITATNDLTVTGNPFATMLFIDSGTIGPDGGQGGNISLTAKNIGLADASMSTGDFFANQIGEEATGSAGDMLLAAETVNLSFSFIVTDAFLAGKGGDLTISAQDVSIVEGALAATGVEQAGSINISADQIMVDASQLEVNNGEGPSGGINLIGRVIDLKNGSTIASQTFGDEPAGNITITATERLTLSDDFTTDGPLIRPTGLYTNSVGIVGTLGKAGVIAVTTPSLSITDGARIDSTSRTSGDAGAISIVSGEIAIAGERPFSRFGETQFFLGGRDQLSSGIYSRTVGSRFCSGPCGDGGAISVSTGFLSLAGGGQINSSTSNTGNGGNVFLQSTNSIAIAGTRADGTPSGIFSGTTRTEAGAGNGGNIALSAGQSVTISDGASVSASSTGTGNAGNIAINAGQQFEMRNGSVKTEAAQASGGNIDIQAIDRIRLVNSSISTSVLGGAGSGGNISIDPNSVILQNSQIIAQAVQGAGGNISIVTPLFLADAGSLVDASSQFGLSGTVNIQSPTSNLAGTVSSLPSSLRQAQSLQTGRCAALADSRSSSLIVAGRDILPAEPGGWSPSPFALMGEEADSLAIASPPVAAMTASADTAVSLRRLTPAGFLTQRFAENGLTGCRA